MSLNQKQFQFTYMIAQLIDFAYKNGYTLTFGDAYAKTGHVHKSKHYDRLAVDFNLFRDGKYLTKTEDHLQLGLFWESIGGSWGGQWNDGNHYSFKEGNNQ